MSTSTLASAIEPQIEKGKKALEAKQYGQAFSILNAAHDDYRGDLKPLELVELLELLSKSLSHQYKMDEAIAYLEQADSILVSHDLMERHFDVLVALTILWNFNGEFEKTYTAAKEALKFNGLSTPNRSNFNTYVGNYYEHLGDYEGSRKYYQIAYDIDKETADSSSFPFVAMDLGYSMMNAGNPEKGLELMFESLSWMRGKQDLHKEVVAYKHIQDLFIQQRNLEKALEYGLKAKAIAEEVQLTLWAAKVKLGLGKCYLRMGEYSMAEAYLDEVIPVFVAKKSQTHVYAAYTEKANLFLQRSELDSSAHYIELARIAKADKHPMISNFLVHSYVSASLEMKLGNLDKAIDLLDTCEETARKFNNAYWKKDISRLQWEVLYEAGEYDLAKEHLAIYETLKDSLFLAERDLIVNELETKYRTAEQNNEIAELNIENERRKSVSRMSVAGLLLSFIALAFLFGLYRLNKRNKDVLEKKNNVIKKSLLEKETLLQEIHHRVKNNLQVISSLLSMQSRYIEDESALNALNEGQTRVESMALIHQNLYREDNITGVSMQTYIPLLADNIFNSYNIEGDKIKIEYNIDNLQLDVATVIPIGLVLNELISNALKYAFQDRKDGLLEVGLVDKNDSLLLYLRDNGIGMTSEVRGTGFGTILINSFTRKLDGELQVSSENGTKVEILIKNYNRA